MAELWREGAVSSRDTARNRGSLIRPSSAEQRSPAPPHRPVEKAQMKRKAPFLKEVDNRRSSRSTTSRPRRSECSSKARNSLVTSGSKKDRQRLLHRLQSCIRVQPVHIQRQGRHPHDQGGARQGQVFHRPRSGGKLRRITAEKTRSGSYYRCILYETQVKPPPSVIPAI